ncbi:MAG: DNA-binding response regulator [Chloroflexi bacterium]|nr:MAG: DNA-binding response regulator [Chloroflexota bacterium]
MTSIRVLLAEDHHVVREGLHLLLDTQPDMKVVGEASSGRQAVDLAARLKPDVAVLDISMPDMDGLEATKLIRTESPGTQVLILSMHQSDVYFYRALEAGAAGYVVKKAASEELLHAVRAVAQGDAYFHPSVARKLLSDFRRGGEKATPGPPGYHKLTEREKEVMWLLINGYVNQEIADKLFISPSTVQAHRSHILEKLGVSSVIDLVRYAIRHGLIEP